jgi:hypothetical protein
MQLRFQRQPVLQIMLLTVLLRIATSCKEHSGAVTPENSFTLNTNKKEAPHAYLRQEGYDSKRNIYYLSLTFATVAVTFDTSAKKLQGYGEAVRYYFYAPKATEAPVGIYEFRSVLDTANLMYQIQKVEVYSGNYSFNYTTNQKGFLYNKSKSAKMTIAQSAAEYKITHQAVVGYTHGNLYEPVQVTGTYTGNIIY